MSNQSKYKNISDDALDQLFRAAHTQEGVEPKFSDSFWHEMESMLPPVQDRKRRPLVFWFVAASVVILGAITGLYYLNSTNIPAYHETQFAQNPRLIGQKSLFKEDHIVAGNTQQVKVEQSTTHSSLISPTRTTAEQNKFVDNNFRRVKSKTTRQNPDNHLTVSIDSTENLAGEKEPKDPIEPNLAQDENEPSGDLFEKETFSIKTLTDNEKYVSTLAKPKFHYTQFYIETGATLGQAPYVNENGSRDLVAGCIIGGGVQITSGKTFFQGGLQMRLEGFKGLSYVETNFTQDIYRYVNVNQLYSVEFPLAFGYSAFKHQVGLSFTPGIQCFMGGTERVVQNNTEVRNNRISGPVAHSSSATLEMGLLYYYHVNARWSAGVKLNVDLLRPFHTDYYLGQSQGYPINGQLAVRARLFR